MIVSDIKIGSGRLVRSITIHGLLATNCMLLERIGDLKKGNYAGVLLDLSSVRGLVGDAGILLPEAAKTCAHHGGLFKIVAKERMLATLRKSLQRLPPAYATKEEALASFCA